MAGPAKKNPELYTRAAECFKALAHPARLRLVHRLQEGDCCVGEIERCLGLSQPNVSQHLKILKKNGLIAGRRQGTKICYRLSDDRLRVVLAAVLGEE
ncbi:MAG: winged helix-turn-helix transcriptional regulator [Candidatus Aminicenantes bacterium]|nr:winged helix-turn-helix transcriptional regulator [Candidatus Aminicenantes bacterium]